MLLNINSFEINQNKLVWLYNVCFRYTTVQELDILYLAIAILVY